MTEFESAMQTAAPAREAQTQAAQAAREAQAQAAEAAQAAAEAQAQQAQAVREQMRDQIRENIRTAVGAAEDAVGAQPGVSVTRGPGGRQVIRVPDGRGGTQEIVIGPRGVTMNGDAIASVDFRNAVPTGVVDIVQAVGATLVLCVVGFPLARAFGRWLDRRGTPTPVPAEVMARLSSIENAVETVAVEVERISEGQRFTTKLLNERATREQQDPLAIGSRAAR